MVCFGVSVLFFPVFRPKVYSGRHVPCVMAARPRATFAHKKTVRLIVDDGMDVNALEIICSLPDFKDEIAGIIPNFGGKCFDITIQSTEAANRLATSGFDYGDERKQLRLLGAKSIHVSSCGRRIPRRRSGQHPAKLWYVENQKFTPPLLFSRGLHRNRMWDSRGGVPHFRQGLALKIGDTRP